MKSEVEQAVKELEQCFPESKVIAVGTPDGGAMVTIDPVDPGPVYVQRETWLKFAISFQYPNADVYPLFVRPDLTRADGEAHGDGIASAEFDGEPATQLSRRSSHLNPASDTAALKVTKVLEWLRTR